MHVHILVHKRVHAQVHGSQLPEALKPFSEAARMAGVAHTPYLEKRPSGFFFRRRLPKAWGEISNPGQNSALCVSLRTDVLSEAKILVARLTALTDMAFALMTERRQVDHLKPEHVALLTELARCQIADTEGACILFALAPGIVTWLPEALTVRSQVSWPDFAEH